MNIQQVKRFNEKFNIRVKSKNMVKKRNVKHKL